MGARPLPAARPQSACGVGCPPADDQADAAATALAPWIKLYDTERRHSALGGKPPPSRLLPI
ncbi:integrase core domain-containing protein [Amycolatopsis thermoflava]|uniref:integrase core domain-containing protein n=1 Tax=Amycolatopsis thermoflava TaxID=84480 RepID=UPI003649B8E3